MVSSHHVDLLWNSFGVLERQIWHNLNADFNWKFVFSSAKATIFFHFYIALLNSTFDLKVWAMYEVLPRRSAGVFYTYYDGRGCVLMEAGYSQVHSPKLRKTHWIVCSQVGRWVVSHVGSFGSRSQSNQQISHLQCIPTSRISHRRTICQVRLTLLRL